MRSVGTSRARRAASVVLAVALTAGLLGGVSAGPAAAAAARTGQEHYDEWDLVARVNASRSAAGLPALKVVSTLRETARNHSERMAAAADLFHASEEELRADAARVSSCWSLVGENVGAGGSTASIHDAWMNSSTHRKNILDEFTYIGIGVEWRNGRLWATQRFLTLRSGCSLSTISKPAFHWLEVDLTGSGDGKVTSSPSGIDCGTDCREPQTSGTRMTLTASAAAGSVFRGWSGSCSGTSTCTVTLDQARSVSALFVARHLLTVTAAGSGSGTVTSLPGGIDCGIDCSETLDEGTEVTLTAVPDQGSAFRGWTGGGCSGEGDCIVTLLAATAVQATFVAQHELDVVVDGSGSGVVFSYPEGIDCGFACSALFDEGAEVTLTASADEGSVFEGWGSDSCFGTEDCTLTMDEAQSVTATFVALHDLDVFKAGTGNGKVTSSPSGIRCGSDCAETFAEGTEIVLTATPNRWSRFTRWGGACAGSSRTCVVVLEQATSVTARFTRRRR